MKRLLSLLLILLLLPAAAPAEDVVYDRTGNLTEEYVFPEGTPVLDDILPLLAEKHYKKIVLMPLMVVAGDHANNDLAGDEEDSWKSILEREGYEVEAHIVGLGELPTVREMYTEHIRAAIA